MTPHRSSVIHTWKADLIDPGLCFTFDVSRLKFPVSRFRQLVPQEPLDSAARDQKGLILDEDGHLLAGHGIRSRDGASKDAHLEITRRRIPLEGAALALHHRPSLI